MPTSFSLARASFSNSSSPSPPTKFVVVLLGRHAQQARMSYVHGASRRKKPGSPAPSGEGLPGWVDENAVCFVRPATATCSGEESLDQRLLSGGRFGNALGKAPASRGVVQFAACSCFERVRARRSSWRVSGSVEAISSAGVPCATMRPPLASSTIVMFRFLSAQM